MASYKEIVTKTVIGKAKKTSKDNVDILPQEKPSTVLGCWVINHTFNGSINNNKVTINGSFDVNVWYSYDSDHKTAVSQKTYNYTDSMTLNLKENGVISTSPEIIVRSLKQPTVSDVSIKGDSISLLVEKELGVEVVGETKIKVPIEDEYDDYEEIIDDDMVDKIIDEVDSEYLK